MATDRHEFWSNLLALLAIAAGLLVFDLCTSAGLGGRYLPLAGLLQARYHLPVTVLNDSQATAIGEYELGINAVSAPVHDARGNVIAAVEAARAKDMTVIALTGHKGGRLRDLLQETDVMICVPHDRTARIQEVHLLVLHCLCDAVDLQLLGEQENT